MKLIGVYGSLKKGFYNHDKLGKDAVFKGQWHAQGKMALIAESYPELKLTEPDGHMHPVELYEVSEEVFKGLDSMETRAGYHQKILHVGGIAEHGELTDAIIWVVNELHGTPIEEYSAVTAPKAVVKDEKNLFKDDPFVEMDAYGGVASPA